MIIRLNSFKRLLAEWVNPTRVKPQTTEELQNAQMESMADALDQALDAFDKTVQSFNQLYVTNLVSNQANTTSIMMSNTSFPGSAEQARSVIDAHLVLKEYNYFFMSRGSIDSHLEKQIWCLENAQSQVINVPVPGLTTDERHGCIYAFVLDSDATHFRLTFDDVDLLVIDK